jgi:lysophospholipase L1-like esterase
LRYAAPLALALALAACGGDDPSLPRLGPSDRILAFGNSLTHGTGAREGEGYPEVLAARIGREVVNAGVPGELSAEGLRRLPIELERAAPRLVVLVHGGNDMLRKKDLGAAEANLRRMVDTIRATGAAVVMLGVPRPGLLLSTADFYERVAEEMRVPIDTDVIPDLLGDNRYKSDAVHPNAAGYARMAEAVESLLREHGAL